MAILYPSLEYVICMYWIILLYNPVLVYYTSPRPEKKTVKRDSTTFQKWEYYNQAFELFCWIILWNWYWNFTWDGVAFPFQCAIAVYRSHYVILRILCNFLGKYVNKNLPLVTNHICFEKKTFSHIVSYYHICAALLQFCFNYSL